MSDFVNGLIVKQPRPKAPEFVKFNISIKRGELIEWLQARDDDWVNAQVKESREGKLYVQVDDWKPSSERATRSESPKEAPKNDYIDDAIPF